MAERTSSAVESAPPVLHVAGRLRDALAPEVLAQLTTDALVRFLSGRRWFAAKAGVPRAARIASVIPVAWDDGSFAIARVDVETDTGEHQTYQLPLAVRDRGKPTEVLAQLESVAGDGLLFDAVEDAAFRRHLADAFARGARFQVRGASWVIEPVGAQPLVVPLEAPIELVTTEQSNTSIRFADEGILKIFRRLEPGQNPDVELSRFLTMRASFPYTPALFGVARFEDRDERTGRVEITMGGMLQEFLPGAVDGWSYVLRGGGQGAGGGAHRGRLRAISALPPPPALCRRSPAPRPRYPRPPRRPRLGRAGGTGFHAGAGDAGGRCQVGACNRRPSPGCARAARAAARGETAALPVRRGGAGARSAAR